MPMKITTALKEQEREKQSLRPFLHMFYSEGHIYVVHVKRQRSVGS